MPAAQGYDGVVCGHIHRANLREIGGTLYANTGDWVESCSALIESEAGQLTLLRWSQLAGAPAATGGGCWRTRREDRARERRLDAADQRRGHDPQGHRRDPRSPRTRSAGHPSAGPVVPSLPELPGNPPGGVAGRARGAGTEALSAARDPHRHRGPPGARGTPLLPGARRALHELLSHALPGVPACPLADSPQRDLRLAAPLPRRRRAHLRQQPEPARAARCARLHRTCTCGAAAWI